MTFYSLIRGHCSAKVSIPRFLAECPDFNTNRPGIICLGKDKGRTIHHSNLDRNSCLQCFLPSLQQRACDPTTMDSEHNHTIWSVCDHRFRVYTDLKVDQCNTVRAWDMFSCTLETFCRYVPLWDELAVPHSVLLPLTARN